MLGLIRQIHGRLVFGRRVRVLADSLSALIPEGSSVLDIGCGSGIIGSLIMQEKPDVSIEGLEVLARPGCLIDYAIFDGQHIPRDDSSVDVCMFVDVLHHTSDIQALLKEAARTSRRYVLIKDHICESGLQFKILKFMDWVGNRPHGVSLPYNYWSRDKWKDAFRNCDLEVVSWDNTVPLYTFPLSIFFGRRLHFIALLRKHPQD